MKTCACGRGVLADRHARCSQCRYAQRVEREGLASLRTIKVPTEPLREFITRERRTVNSVFNQRDRDTRIRNYHRYAWRPYISMKTADEVACGLGVHPFEIWGFEWFDFGEEVSA